MKEKFIPEKKNNDEPCVDKKVLIFRAGMSPTESNKKIGPIRAHLYNYSYAKSEAMKGKDSKIIYRVDDTDKEKHTKEKSIEIYKFFSDVLGFNFDITPDNSLEKIGKSVIQSERQDVYQKYLEELYDKGVVFTEKESGMVLFDIKKFLHKYTDVIEIDDLLKGRVALRLEENLKRGTNFFPVLRSDKSALYHLATVIDDADFGVTHVVRGIDKLSVAEYQEMIRVALGLKPKKYLHTPMLFDKDGKIPKSGVKFDDFLRMGVTPQALISYMVSSGYGDPESVYPSLDDFIRKFDFKKIHKNNGKFDLEKLLNINEKIVRKMSPEIYIDSIILYLYKSGKDELAETLKKDSDLCELLISIRRKPVDSLDILKCILEPDYEDDSSLKNEIMNYLFDNSGKIFNELPLDPRALEFDKKEFFDSLRWIIVGKRSFPNIDKIVVYLKSKNLLFDRINTAKLKYNRKNIEN